MSQTTKNITERRLERLKVLCKEEGTSPALERAINLKLVIKGARFLALRYNNNESIYKAGIKLSQCATHEYNCVRELLNTLDPDIDWNAEIESILRQDSYFEELT